MDSILAFFASRSPGFRIGRGQAAWTAKVMRQHNTGSLQPVTNLHRAARERNWRLIGRPPAGMLVVDLDDSASIDSRYVVGDDLDEGGVAHIFVPSSVAILDDEGGGSSSVLAGPRRSTTTFM